MALVRGQLAASNVAGNSTLTDVYTVPAAKLADVNISIANRSASTTSVRVAHIKADVAANVADEDYILYDLPTSSLADNRAPIEFTGILMSAGDTIAVYSSSNALSVQINGIEEDV